MTSFLSPRLSANRLRRRREDGYVLLTLLLMVALMGIFALTVVVPIKFEIQREQEQEMIHRGVQYSRAIRAYYKKFGRYPTRLEDLDNTNNLRYLRKHYKDPMTGKDFKLLHYGDPGVTLTGGFGGAPITGANTVGQLNAASNSGFGGQGAGSAFSQRSAFGGNSSGGFGGSSSGAFGGGFNNPASSGTSATPGGSNAPGTTGASGTDSSQTSSQTAPGSKDADTSSSSQKVFGGGPIVGVASISKKDTIRVFNKKKKYNEWQFVYDPTIDRGGLLTTPSQPALQISANPLGPNGQPAGANPNGNPFGQPTGFGNNNPGLTNNPTTPVQPPSANAPPQ
jgi:type II secretory pathway pseudopilin PulG